MSVYSFCDTGRRLRIVRVGVDDKFPEFVWGWTRMDDQVGERGSWVLVRMLGNAQRVSSETRELH